MFLRITNKNFKAQIKMEILNGKIKLFISVVPNSNTTKIKHFDDDEIKIEIDEPPENNKANNRLMKFLSKIFKIEKSKIQILCGATSKHKIVLLEKCLTEEEVKRIIQSAGS